MYIWLRSRLVPLAINARSACSPAMDWVATLKVVSMPKAVNLDEAPPLPAERNRNSKEVREAVTSAQSYLPCGMARKFCWGRATKSVNDGRAIDMPKI